MHSLPLLHRLHGQVVIVLGAGEAAQAKARLLERAGAHVSRDEAADARLAFVALDAPDAAEAAAARLKARGVLVNVVDRPALCDFTTPSVLERGPVLVAIGTGGASAGLAKALRIALEAVLPHSLGLLADRLAAARPALRRRWADGAARRRALDQALAAGGPLDPLDAGSADRVDAWLADAADGAAGCTEFAMQSDDPDDLTLRQARWLASADVVAHEPGVAAAVLHRARADAQRMLLPRGAPAPDGAGRIVVIRRG